MNNLRSKNIKYVVISWELAKKGVQSQLRQDEFIVEHIFDSRSAGYIATGICAERREPVILITENNNDSRKCYSALTEAYYKKLPIIFLTINTGGYSLDYINELRDATISTEFVNENNSFDNSIIDLCIEKKMPVHIIIEENTRVLTDKFDICDNISILNDSSCYLYLSNSFVIPSDFNVRRSAIGGCDGGASNILGASLSGNFKKYIGILTDEELLHDLNALGNRFMNDSVSFLVYSLNNRRNIIADYARDLGFSIYKGESNIPKLLENKKAIVFVDEWQS